MKIIKLQNKDLSPAILFLKSLPLKGKATRGKQKFIERLVEKNKELAKQEEEVIKPYALLDQEENIILKEGSFDFKEDTTAEEKAQFVNERNELMEEVAEISFVEYSEKYEALFAILDDWQEPIAPEYSFIYDKLMDEYEANEDKKEEGK